ncbi:MAG: oligosaccharide flippase family protein [Flavobacteriaceae bacterium]|nr:oligosaccharide flippase family protein [Flavobacteriaceae bacterium]
MENIHYKEIITKSGHALLYKLLGILINYLLIFFISRRISVDAVGIYNISFVILVFFSSFLSFGLNFSITRLIGEYMSDKKKLKALYFKSMIALAIVSAAGALLLFLFSSEISQKLFKDTQYDCALKLVSAITPFYILMAFNIEYIRGLKKIKESEFVRNVFNPLTILLSLFILTFFNIDNTTAVYAISISVFLGFLVSTIFIIRFNHGFFSLTQKEISLRSLLAPSIPLMIMGLAAFFLSESGLFILEIYHGPKEVGDYTIVYKISLASSLVFLTFSTIIGPKFAELFWSKQYEDLKKSMLYSSQMIFILSTPILIVLILLSNTFLALFQPSSSDLLNLSLIVAIIGQFIYGILGVSGVFLMVTSYQKIFRNIYILAAVINLILCFLLIPEYDVLGACIAISASYIILNVICTIFVYKKENILALYIPLLKNK